jgi:hypothetical protein
LRASAAAAYAGIRAARAVIAARTRREIQDIVELSIGRRANQGRLSAKQIAHKTVAQKRQRDMRLGFQAQALGLLGNIFYLNRLRYRSTKNWGD